MTMLKLDLNTKIFESVTAEYFEQAMASLKIHVSLLGDLLKVGEVHIKALESAAAKNAKSSLEISLKPEVESKIYDPLEASLRDNISNQTLDQDKLLPILTDLEAKAQAYIKTVLPTIGVGLQVQAREQFEAAGKSVEVNIPLLFKVSVDITFNEKATVDTSVGAGLKASAKMDPKASAQDILDSL